MHQSAQPRRVATSAHEIHSSSGSCGGLRSIFAAAVVWRVEYDPKAAFSPREPEPTNTSPSGSPARRMTAAGNWRTTCSDGTGRGGGGIRKLNPVGLGGGLNLYGYAGWYRAGWGRYTQANPSGLIAGTCKQMIISCGKTAVKPTFFKDSGNSDPLPMVPKKWWESWKP